MVWQGRIQGERSLSPSQILKSSFSLKILPLVFCPCQKYASDRPWVGTEDAMYTHVSLLVRL